MIEAVVDVLRYLIGIIIYAMIMAVAAYMEMRILTCICGCFMVVLLFNAIVAHRELEKRNT